MTDRCDRSLFPRVSDLEDHGAALDAVCASLDGAREHGTMPGGLRDWLVSRWIAFAKDNALASTD